MNANYAKKLFGTAALFNFSAGVPILFAGRQVAVLFGFPPPENLLFAQISGLAVLLFGLGYWMEARRPGENRAAVVVGMVGKIGIFMIAAGHIVVGDVGWLFPTLAGVDLGYAYLFWRYLGKIK